MFRSTTHHPSNGDSTAQPRPRPTGSAPSIVQPPMSQKAREFPLLSPSSGDWVDGGTDAIQIQPTPAFHTWAHISAHRMSSRPPLAGVRNGASGRTPRPDCGSTDRPVGHYPTGGKRLARRARSVRFADPRGAAEITDSLRVRVKVDRPQIAGSVCVLDPPAACSVRPRTSDLGAEGRSPLRAGS